MTRLLGGILDKETEKSASECISDFFGFLGVGIDTHTKDSPLRITKMYNEFFQTGREEPRFTTFESDSNDMVLIKDIHFYSLCSHHFLPFFGVVHVAYIPDGLIAGLSKIVRVVNYFSHRPQVQEELTSQVADYLVEKLETENVAVIMSCEHLCMSMRGVNSPGHQTITAALRGGFFDDAKVRSELYSMLGVGK